MRQKLQFEAAYTKAIEWSHPVIIPGLEPNVAELESLLQYINPPETIAELESESKRLDGIWILVETPTNDICLS